MGWGGVGGKVSVDVKFIMQTCPCNEHPTFYSKTGVYRGIHYFLIFVLKHILWVLVRTASMRRF